MVWDGLRHYKWNWTDGGGRWLRQKEKSQEHWKTKYMLDFKDRQHRWGNSKERSGNKQP